MYSFMKHAVLILNAIIITNSEGWYPTTFFGRKPQFNSTQTNFETDHIHLNKHDYVPLILLNSKNPDIVTTPENVDNRNPALVNADVLINYNNTINNVNILRRIRPKKMQVRRGPGTPWQRQQLKKQSAKSRFLEVLQVVEFDHVSCTSISGLDGTCLHEYACTASGGLTMGSCADGYGTCCVSQFQCDTRSAAATGWFTNPDFPSPSSARLSCAFILDKASEDIKQIRLDFITFELLPPTAGVCQQDQFVVSGQNVNNIIPILCGINTGQHVYIEVSDVDGPIILSIQTESSESRLFAIKVTQLTWADELAAPTGCLQYFNEPVGYLESFNYRDKSEIAIARATSYLNNLNYAMCIERGPETCSVTYTNAGSMQIVNYDTDGLPVIPPGQAGVEILNCPSDWLLIAATRLCGDRLNDGSVFQDFSLNAPIKDNSAGPIVIWFRSDEAYVGYGYKLKYHQNPCSMYPYPVPCNPESGGREHDSPTDSLPWLYNYTTYYLDGQPSHARHR